MDNASKALVIIGGILITVMLISLFMYLLTSARGLAQTSNEALSTSEKMAFNRFFEYYNSTISGLDAYNIIGKIKDINATNGYEMIKLTTTIGNTDLANKPTNTFANVYIYDYSYNDGIVSSVSITN